MADQNDKLLNEYEQSRNELRDMEKEVDELYDKLKSSMNLDTKDFRNAYMLDNKLKVLSTILKSKLDIKKEINKSIKDEISVRNKLTDNEKSDINLSKIFNDRDNFETLKNIINR